MINNTKNKIKNKFQDNIKIKKIEKINGNDIKTT